MIETYYKYDSGAKKFKEMTIRSIGNTCASPLRLRLALPAVRCPRGTDLPRRHARARVRAPFELARQGRAVTHHKKRVAALVRVRASAVTRALCAWHAR